MTTTSEQLKIVSLMTWSTSPATSAGRATTDSPAGERADEQRVAVERQVGQPVGLAVRVVVHRGEPGGFEPPRGSRAHVLDGVVAVHDHRAGPVQLVGARVEFLQRQVDRAG